MRLFSRHSVLSDVGGVKAAPKSNANREEAMSAKADAKNTYFFLFPFALIFALLRAFAVRIFLDAMRRLIFTRHSSLDTFICCTVLMTRVDQSIRGRWEQCLWGQRPNLSS